MFPLSQQSRELWGAWVTSLWISSHHLLLDWKKKKKKQNARGELTQLLSLPITFLSSISPHPFFHSIWRSILTDFKANPHSPPNFNLSLSFPLLVCCFHITLSAWTSIKPTLSEHISPCSIPWKAGLTGQPWVHHLPRLPQSSALWIPQQLAETALLAHRWHGSWTGGHFSDSSCKRSAALNGGDGPLALGMVRSLVTSNLFPSNLPGYSCSITFNNFFSLAWPCLHVKSSLCVGVLSSLFILHPFLQQAHLLLLFR